MHLCFARKGGAGHRACPFRRIPDREGPVPHRPPEVHGGAEEVAAGRRPSLFAFAAKQTMKRASHASNLSRRSQP